MMRVIVYLGKGGGGKTTIAAATALRSAELGYKTLVISIDPIPTLAQVLDTALDSQPRQVAESLWAQEVSAMADWQQQQATLWRYLAQLSGNDGLKEVMPDVPMVFPGVDAVLSLFHLNRYVKEGQFERVILDATAAGEALRLLTMSDTFRRSVDSLTRADTLLQQVLQSFVGGALLPSATPRQMLSGLERAAVELQHVLRDPTISSYRVVVRPEKIAMHEAQRACAFLSLFEYPIDSVIVNGVLPDAGNGSAFWEQRRAVQGRHLQTIEHTFRPFPVWRVSDYTEEVAGLPLLSQLARECFGDTDPGAVLYRGGLQEVTQRDGKYLLRIPLFFATKSGLRVRKRAERLLLTLGNFQREIILPPLLAQRKAGEGRLVDGMLEILFLG